MLFWMLLGLIHVQTEFINSFIILLTLETLKLASLFPAPTTPGATNQVIRLPYLCLGVELKFLLHRTINNHFIFFMLF